jgi:formylmethanofuran dehydrogenase subunit C
MNEPNIEVKEMLLKSKGKFAVPVEVEKISPDLFKGKSIEEIKKISVYEGNTKRVLEDLFEIEGQSAQTVEEIQITINGDLSKVRRIGDSMSGGKIIINGNVGHYVGNKMGGGNIIIKGNTGLWLGAKAKGGSIEVFGNAGDCIAGSYRGEMPGKGMKDGLIIIHGNAGAEIGRSMKGGNIVIEGDAGSLPGVDMRGGNIGIKGNCEGKVGARMNAGKIVISGFVSDVLPSFYIDGIKEKTKVAGEKIAGPFYVFMGDVISNVKCGGKLFVSTLKNPHLKIYESLLG